MQFRPVVRIDDIERGLMALAVLGDLGFDKDTDLVFDPRELTHCDCVLSIDQHTGSILVQRLGHTDTLLPLDKGIPDIDSVCRSQKRKQIVNLGNDFHLAVKSLVKCDGLNLN